MKGDFARVTFDPTLHYSQVFQQQGRVLLEADWNEQGAIQLHLLRTLAADLIGPCWAAGNGFRITTVDSANKTLPLEDWSLSAGHFYADGILCVNETACTLAGEPYRPTPDYGIADGRTGFENAKGPYALWLDVWERHLSWVEAPHVADTALNGVDTCSRAQVVWQLRLLDEGAAKASLQAVLDALQRRHDALDPAGDEAKQLDAAIQTLQKNGGKLLDEIYASLGGTAGDERHVELACERLRALLNLRATHACPQLRAQLQPPESDQDPCVIAADARYRGCENQLYRVEIHQGGLAAVAEPGVVAAGAASATFKWSRENGSVIFPIVDCGPPGEPDADGSASMPVTLASLGRDARLGLAVGDRVELLDDDYALAQRAFPLLQVIAIDAPNRRVTLQVPKSLTPYQPSADPHKHPLLRRWDQQGEDLAAEGVLDVQEGEWLDLEDGIQIRFEPGGLYATGDYWVIPARVAGNGTLDWPQEADASGKATAAAVRASGLHHRAVLGGVDAAGVYRECCCRWIPACTQRLLALGKAAERLDLPPPPGALRAAAPLRAAAQPAAKTVRNVRPTKPKGRAPKRKPG
ncbi:hypothetical protein MBSD_n1639 [Mizugakiibacter sediminis]|uniref:Uncharacterized protein n=1 Tax=Mizugakiibacter sediminis TaxID=1475481 RepID=A0A0K8QPJ4_9GAMM|nr:DUF6519 domain-containing protein [Mizugakiibacter sediminis]GAP66332.1 hypothetical protein MBSD_n1639 [Mizugakiibacter sediminis]